MNRPSLGGGGEQVLGREEGRAGFLEEVKLNKGYSRYSERQDPWFHLCEEVCPGSWLLDQGRYQFN